MITLSSATFALDCVDHSRVMFRISLQLPRMARVKSDYFQGKDVSGAAEFGQEEIWRFVRNLG